MKLKNIQAVLAAVEMRKTKLQIAIDERLNRTVGVDAEMIAALFEKLRNFEKLSAFIREKAKGFLTSEEMFQLRDKFEVDVDMGNTTKPTLKIFVDKDEVVAITPENLSPPKEDFKPRKPGEGSEKEDFLKVWSQTHPEGVKY